MEVPHKVQRIHWWALAQTLGPILLVSVVAIWVTLRYVQPSPPHTITMATGTPGSAFDQEARAYKKILAANGIILNLVPTQGSVQNLKLLSEPHAHVDVALVQSGIQKGQAPNLVSLGSMFYQPLRIFYHAPKPMERLSELAGKRIAAGPKGSGTRYIAEELLKVNDLDPETLHLQDLEGEPARQALLHHEVDAIFLASDSTSLDIIHEMVRTEGIRLFDFTRADAYIQKFPYLHKILIPAGAYDIGKDLPSSDLTLLAPTVELLAQPSLHSALSDLLIEAATEVHNGRRRTASEFPKPLANDFPLSDAAARYYKSGDRSFLYRNLPFWLASLVNRLVALLLPLVVIVIPGLRYAPQLYSWRINSKIHHRYGQLMALERESLAGGLSEERRAALIDRLNEIEHALIGYKIPGSHAEQLYMLRQHISFVRAHLSRPAALDPRGSVPAQAPLAAHAQ